MIRTRSPLMVNTANHRRPSHCATIIRRGSSTARASEDTCPGSSHMAWAVTKSIPCLLALLSLLAGSNSNSTRVSVPVNSSRHNGGLDPFLYRSRPPCQWSRADAGSIGSALGTFGSTPGACDRTSLRKKAPRVGFIQFSLLLDVDKVDVIHGILLVIAKGQAAEIRGRSGKKKPRTP